jgi:hypothetical protein
MSHVIGHRSGVNAAPRARWLTSRRVPLRSNGLKVFIGPERKPVARRRAGGGVDFSLRAAALRPFLAAGSAFWSAVTGHRFFRGDLSRSNDRGCPEEWARLQLAPAVWRAWGFVAVSASDGDKSPAQSGDKSPHSKSRPRASRFRHCARNQSLPPPVRKCVRADFQSRLISAVPAGRDRPPKISPR